MVREAAALRYIAKVRYDKRHVLRKASRAACSVCCAEEITLKNFSPLFWPPKTRLNCPPKVPAPLLIK